jgi:hypothetical protein
MTISLSPIGPNHNEVIVSHPEFEDSVRVFSYKTLVAVGCRGVPGAKLYKTNQFHSVTTSKHINKSGFKDATPVSPEDLAKLAEG